MAGIEPILPQPKALSRNGYMATIIRKVTRNALRMISPGVLRPRRAPFDFELLGRAVERSVALIGWVVNAVSPCPDSSRSLGGLLPEQARRLEDQDHHQKREHDRFRPARVPDVVGRGGDNADQDTAQKGALNVANAAHD